MSVSDGRTDRYPGFEKQIWRVLEYSSSYFLYIEVLLWISKYIPLASYVANRYDSSTVSQPEQES